MYFFTALKKDIFRRLTNQFPLERPWRSRETQKIYYWHGYPLKYLFVQFNKNWARKTCIVDSLWNNMFHLSPGLYAAAKIAIFLVLWKIASLTIFRVSCDFSQFFVMVIFAEIAKIAVFAGHLLYLL